MSSTKYRSLQTPFYENICNPTVIYCITKFPSTDDNLTGIFMVYVYRSKRPDQIPYLINYMRPKQ